MELTEIEYAKLVKLAYHDNLTGCYNRNWYLENYNDDSEFKFVIVDINNLKKINDEQGHNVGDTLIKDVADKLSTYGKVIRFGGDEFILIVGLDFDVHQLNDVRYSYGWEIKTKKETLVKCLEIADMYMYKHKRNSKNTLNKKRLK